MSQNVRPTLGWKLITPLPFLLVIALLMNFTTSLSTVSAAASPLTVTLTSPTSNGLYGNRTPLLLSASVTDSAANATITSVAFYNGTTLLGTVTSAPYNLSRLPQFPGPNTLTAKAYDSLGNVATSQPVTIQVFVQDPLPPSVITLTSPVNGTIYTAPATIVLTASISQPSNPIVSVSFFQGSTLLGTSTSAPYRFTWQNVAAGTYSLMATYSDTFAITETSATVTVTVSGTLPVTAINAGGGAVAPFVADTDFSGGANTTSSNTISTSGVSNPAPLSVYQTNRYGNFTYTIPNLTPNTSYPVRLDFAETYWKKTGQRVFNVSANGQPALTNFDIIAAAAGNNKAVAKHFNVTSSASGTITLQFTKVKDNAQVNGIEIGGSTITGILSTRQAYPLEAERSGRRAS